MLPHEKREALLALHRQDIPLREISRLLKISRNTVRRVLREETSPVPREPTGKWQSVVSQLPELHSRTRGNAVRIQELVAEELGVEIPYSTLTHLLRREQLS
jgi:transposase